MAEPILRQLILHRFRSLRLEQVEFDNPTFLVGQNGSGKSNFADAFTDDVPILYQSYELTLYSRPFSRTQFFDRIVACCIGIPRLTACQNNGIISLKTPIG